MEEITLFSTKRRRKGGVQASKPQHIATSDDKDDNEAQLTAQPATPERAPGDASPSDPSPSGKDAEEPSESASFKDLGVSDWLCGVLRSLGITAPTPVQRGCIPAVLAGRDVVGTAQTGSGKTAAFALPILQLLARDPYGVFALVLTPTRELAVQLAEQFRAFGAGMNLRDCVVIGGVEQQAQAKELAKRPHVVVATPGRLAELIAGDAGLARGFARTRFLVLDEADRLLEPTFEAPLRTVLSALPPDGRQTLLFSATATRALERLRERRLAGAHVFSAYDGLKTADKLRQEYVFVPAKVKDVYLHHLLESLPAAGVRSAVVFVGTCRGCRQLALLLRELGHSCAELHAGKQQRERLAALAAFRSEATPLLLATDVAARGLDIPTVDLVVNYDLPVAARDYVHRVGRTARAGRGGWSLSFVTQYDVELVHAIEALIGQQLAAHDGLPEDAVLKGITRVYAAKKRAAVEAIAEDRAAGARGGGGGGGLRKRRQEHGSSGGGGGSGKKERSSKGGGGDG